MILAVGLSRKPTSFPLSRLTQHLASLGLQLIQGGQTYVIRVTQVSGCWLVSSPDGLAVS